MEIEITKTVEIAKLSLKPGDVLVVKSEQSLPRSILDKLGKQLTTYLPEGVKCMVLDRTLSITTLTAADIAARSWQG